MRFGHASRPRRAAFWQEDHRHMAIALLKDTLGDTEVVNTTPPLS